MSGNSVPQSYSHLLLSITYNAPAGASDLVFAQANLASKGTQAKPTKAGEAKLRVKAASLLSFARLSKVFDKTASHVRQF